MTKDVDWENGLYPAACLQVAQFPSVPSAAIFEKIDDRSRTHLPVLRLSIDEDRPRANVANHVSRRDERKSGNKNLIVRMHICQH